jgi:glycosyltransferase involved in cell wall biosynthesis
MKIWANTIVNNEENFVWFSIMSIIDFVDKIIVYDTGSTDKTVEIIKQIQKTKKDKIIFKEVGHTSERDFPKLRQQMLIESSCDWILVLDGDEIWWKKSIKEIINILQNKGTNISGIVVPMKVSVGDIYHMQDEDAGKYEILGRKGHLSLRVISTKIAGLHVNLPYGKEGYFDSDNRLIQERGDIIFLNAPYLHTTHLKRSTNKRLTNKFKYELGKTLPQNFNFPESLYLTPPKIVPSPWNRISGLDLAKAKLVTPIRKIKRKILN